MCKGDICVDINILITSCEPSTTSLDMENTRGIPNHRQMYKGGQTRQRDQWQWQWQSILFNPYETICNTVIDTFAY